MLPLPAGEAITRVVPFAVKVNMPTSITMLIEAICFRRRSAIGQHQSALQIFTFQTDQCGISASLAGHFLCLQWAVSLCQDLKEIEVGGCPGYGLFGVGIAIMLHNLPWSSNGMGETLKLCAL